MRGITMGELGTSVRPEVTNDAVLPEVSALQIGKPLFSSGERP